MALDPKEKHTDKKDKMQKERRGFLKKAAYTAPSLLVLGALSRSTKAIAETENSWDPGPGSQTTWTTGA